MMLYEHAQKLRAQMKCFREIHNAQKCCMSFSQTDSFHFCLRMHLESIIINIKRKILQRPSKDSFLFGDFQAPLISIPVIKSNKNPYY